MENYQYKHGDRPLEGYTIQRAAGRGGFGEVYYALSDSGREVALKTIQNYASIELRGISQCMNLKSPHLVSIFDVKYNQQNQPFVVMEYVAGPSLRDLLNESPNGLGPQKAAFFLREIAKGLSYLHECGIVHRDLKPSNIFYENGYAKIGDYGLTKAISASRHTGHTITVGTVHYMAPEIGAGSYDRHIDIYALGILFYEMLTGNVPYIGESPAEILMKHMSAEPQLDGIDETFARVIRKSLAKDPTQRYQTVREMIEDVFGAEHIRNSVSQFKPEELSVAAEHVAQKVQAAQQQQVAPAKGEENLGRNIGQAARSITDKADAIRRKVAERVDTRADKLLGITPPPRTTYDPIDNRQRQRLAWMAMAMVAIGTGVLASQSNASFMTTVLTVFVMIAAASRSILYWRKRWLPNLEVESQWIGKMAACAVASLIAVLVGVTFTSIIGGIGIPSNLGPFGRSWLPHLPRIFHMGPAFRGTGPIGPMWLALTIPMLLVDWIKLGSPQRTKRLSLGSAMWIGLMGLIAAEFFNAPGLIVAAVLAGTALVVQASSPIGLIMQTHQPPAQPQSPDTGEKPKTNAPIQPKTVSPWIRTLWLLGFIVTLSLAICQFIWVPMKLRGDAFGVGLTIGFASLILSVFCLKMRQRNYDGFYRYLIKPLIMLLCVQVVTFVLFGTIWMSELKRDPAWVFAWIIPAAAVFIIIAATARKPRRRHAQHTPTPTPPPLPIPPEPQACGPVIQTSQGPRRISTFKRIWALILSAGMFVGIFGLQRFYVGKIGTGILWFLTGGLFGIGQIVDVILIAVGQFKDRYDLPIVQWHDEPVYTACHSRQARPVSPAVHYQPEPKQQPKPEHEADTPAKPPTQPEPTTTVIYSPFNPLGFLMSGLGTICMLTAIILGLAIGLKIAFLVAAGWPNAEIAVNIEQVFGVTDWPRLVTSLGKLVISLLIILSIVFTAIGRRSHGGAHMFRAMLGLVGILAAMLIFSGLISGAYDFGQIAETLSKGRAGQAIEQFMETYDPVSAIASAVTFVLAVVILAWPAKPKQTVLTAIPNQGAG